MNQAKQRYLLVGSGPECDLVVAEKVVSERHCRITLDNAQVILEDLGSTNGTYVNGVRIQAPTIVTRSDRVTLGQSVPLPWPGDLKGESYIIGRSPDCDIVLDLPNVSARHARLSLQGQTMTIVDLKSTNGLALGSPDHRIQQAAISADDVLYFGSTAVNVRTLLEQRPTPTMLTQNRAQLGLIGAVAALLMLLGIWYFSGGPADEQAGNVSQGDSSTPADSQGNPVEPGNDDGEATQAPTTSADSTRPNETPSVTRQNPSATGAETSSGPYFAVVIAGVDQAYRVGTAWAVSPTELVTSGSVVETMETLREEFPQTSIYDPVSKAQIPIVRTTYHPRFKLQLNEFNESLAEYYAVDRALEQATEDAERKQLANRLNTLKAETLAKADAKVPYDVAVLEVSPGPKQILELAKNAPRPKLRVELTGLAFDKEDPFFDPSETHTTSSLPCRVGIQKGSLLVEADNDSHRLLSYYGAPLLDKTGKVIGAYSRAAGDETGSQASEVEFFEAAAADQIRAVLSHHRSSP